MKLLLTFRARTGIHIIAATFLLPVGVALYTFVGGIKATFLTDYLHTFTILIVLCWFTTKAFTVPGIDSIGHLYELVMAAGQKHPVEGNHDGSYLTMTAKGVSKFTVLNTLLSTTLTINYFVDKEANQTVPGHLVRNFASAW